MSKHCHEQIQMITMVMGRATPNAPPIIIANADSKFASAWTSCPDMPLLPSSPSPTRARWMCMVKKKLTRPKEACSAMLKRRAQKRASGCSKAVDHARLGPTRWATSGLLHRSKRSSIRSPRQRARGECWAIASRAMWPTSDLRSAQIRSELVQVAPLAWHLAISCQRMMLHRHISCSHPGRTRSDLRRHKNCG